MRRLLMAGIALALQAGGGAAADLGPYPRGGSIKDAPEPVYSSPGYNWSGLYAGVQVGYGWGDVDASSAALAGVFNQGYAYSADGFLGGIHAGYNWQANSFLVGVETDVELSGVGGTGVGTLGSAHAVDLDWLGSFRGRIGLPAGSTLFYLTGGLAYGSADISSPAANYNVWRTGWTLGGGIEQALAPNMTARLEYRYTDLGTWKDSSSGAFDQSDLTFNTVRAGLSFKF